MYACRYTSLLHSVQETTLLISSQEPIFFPTLYLSSLVGIFAYFSALTQKNAILNTSWILHNFLNTFLPCIIIAYHTSSLKFVALKSSWLFYERVGRLFPGIQVYTIFNQDCKSFFNLSTTQINMNRLTLYVIFMNLVGQQAHQ